MFQNRRTATRAGLLSMAAALMVAGGCAMSGDPRSTRNDFNICHYIFPYTAPLQAPAAVDPCTYGFRPTKWHHWPTNWDSCVPGPGRMAVDMETIAAGQPDIDDELQPVPEQSMVELVPAPDAALELDAPVAEEALEAVPDLPTPFDDVDESQESGVDDAKVDAKPESEVKDLEVPPMKLDEQPGSEGDTGSTVSGDVIQVAASEDIEPGVVVVSDMIGPDQERPVAEQGQPVVEGKKPSLLWFLRGVWGKLSETDRLFR